MIDVNKGRPKTLATCALTVFHTTGRQIDYYTRFVFHVVLYLYILNISFFWIHLCVNEIHIYVCLILAQASCLYKIPSRPTPNAKALGKTNAQESDHQRPDDRPVHES